MSYLLAILPVVCVMTVGAVWLARAARELSQKHSALAFAEKQMAIYSLMFAKSSDVSEKQIKLEQAELSREIYKNVVEEYNCCIAKPGYRPVAKVLGFSPAHLAENESILSSGKP